MVSESMTNSGIFQVAWMPRIQQTINISVRCTSIPTSTKITISIWSSVLANTAAAAVPQAMAIPVAILGWVTSGKGIRGKLLWGTLPETRAGSKDIWGLTVYSLLRQPEHLPGSPRLFVVQD